MNVINLFIASVEDDGKRMQIITTILVYLSTLLLNYLSVCQIFVVLF